MAGRFITLEGGEGTGKSTQIRRLASALEQQSTATREISGSAQHASAALNDINTKVKMIAA